MLRSNIDVLFWLLIFASQQNCSLSMVTTYSDFTTVISPSNTFALQLAVCGHFWLPIRNKFPRICAWLQALACMLNWITLILTCPDEWLKYFVVPSLLRARHHLRPVSPRHWGTNLSLKWFIPPSGEHHWLTVEPSARTYNVTPSSSGTVFHVHNMDAA